MPLALCRIIAENSFRPVMTSLISGTVLLGEFWAIILTVYFLIKRQKSRRFERVVLEKIFYIRRINDYLNIS